MSESVAKDFETIRYEQMGAVGVITLDRPDCLNAINFAERNFPGFDSSPYLPRAGRTAHD